MNGIAREAHDDRNRRTDLYSTNVSACLKGRRLEISFGFGFLLGICSDWYEGLGMNEMNVMATQNHKSDDI